MLNLILGSTTAALFAIFTPVAYADEVEQPRYCSCVTYLHQLLPAAPLVDANWYQTFGFRTTPAVGRVALFQYDEVSHVAFVTKLEAGGFWVKEANYKPCQKGERFVKWDNAALVGFLKM